MIKAVIFDLDGTLVDTIPVYLAAYIEVINRDLGITVPEKNIKDQFGKRATDIMVALLDDRGIDPNSVSIDNIIDNIRKQFMGHFEDILILPGVIDVLDETRKHYKLALATSSRKYAADTILDNFDLRKYFDTVVTGDDVTHSKPDPEIFLLAAKNLGVEPKNCAVFEDAIHGINAAKAAGMVSIGVASGGLTKKELKNSNPDIFINSMSDFDLQILERL